MHTEEPALSPDDLSGLRSRTLVMVGDDDEVKLEHAVAMYRAIGDGELMVVRWAPALAASPPSCTAAT